MQRIMLLATAVRPDKVNDVGVSVIDVYERANSLDLSRAVSVSRSRSDHLESRNAVIEIEPSLLEAAGAPIKRHGVVQKGVAFKIVDVFHRPGFGVGKLGHQVEPFCKQADAHPIEVAMPNLRAVVNQSESPRILTFSASKQREPIVIKKPAGLPWI